MNPNGFLQPNGRIVRTPAGLAAFVPNPLSLSHDGVQRVQRLQDLREGYRERVQATRAAARLLQAVDLIFIHPLVTVSQVQTALKVQFPMAQRYVDQLVAAGMLRGITGRARNRVYQADGILKAVEGRARYAT